MESDSDRDAPVMVVDGNSLVHRSFHALAWTGARGADGAPTWAIRGLLTQLVAAAERVGPRAIIVGFDDPDSSRRRDRWPSYKAHRADKLPTLVTQLERAAAVLAELGIHVVTPSGWEADDVLAAAARAVAADGGRTVLVTSDRDAFGLIDEATSVLRVISGGVEGSPVLTPDRLELLVGVRPGQYPDFAALRGDPSDNLPGVDGIGPKRAALLLRQFGTAERVFADVAAGGDRVRELLGSALLARLADPDARERWQLNRQVMCPRDDIDVGIRDRVVPGGLPLSPGDLLRVITAHGLPGTAARSVRVLGDQADEAPEPPPLDELGWDPRAEWRSRPVMPRLPVDLQPTLF